MYYYDSSDYYPHHYLCLYNVSADVPSGFFRYLFSNSEAFLSQSGFATELRIQPSALVPLFIAEYKC